MVSIPLLGGPRDGESIEVPEGPPPTIELEEWLVNPNRPKALRFRAWARSYGYSAPSLMHRTPPEVISAYGIYQRWMNSGAPARRTVQYRLLYWGTPWRLHYVHPYHVAAPLAEAL